MTLSQKESASRFQFLKPCFTGNNISTNDTSSFENTPFTCLHQGDGNAENELQRLKLDIVGRRPENCRAVENEARELQNQHLSQGLKNLEHQPSDKRISISKYPIQNARRNHATEHANTKHIELESSRSRARGT